MQLICIEHELGHALESQNMYADIIIILVLIINNADLYLLTMISIILNNIYNIIDWSVRV